MSKIGKCSSCSQERVLRYATKKQCAQCYHHEYYLATKQVQKQAYKLRYAKNKDRILAASKRRYFAHKVERLKKGKVYRDSHKEIISAYKKNWREVHADHVREKKRQEYLAHRTEIIQRSKTWQQNHREERKAYLQAYYQAYKLRMASAIRRRDRQWRQRNPEKSRAHSQRRRALIRQLPATLTIDQWKAILAAYDFRCAYCGKRTPRLEQDHVIPVKRGGG